MLRTTAAAREQLEQCLLGSSGCAGSMCAREAGAARATHYLNSSHNGPNDVVIHLRVSAAVVLPHYRAAPLWPLRSSPLRTDLVSIGCCSRPAAAGCCRYIAARADASDRRRHLLYERALKALPGSYKVRISNATLQLGGGG